MKKIVCGVMVLVLLVVSSPFALAGFTREDIPAPSDENFEPYEFTDSSFHGIITGIRFDLDDESMPVVIINYTVENVSERSKYASAIFWIETTDSFTTGSGSMLMGVGFHYKNYSELDIRNSELKPGQSITFELAYQIDNFTDNIYIFFLGNDKERRIYNPQEINHYTVSYR